MDYKRVAPREQRQKGPFSMNELLALSEAADMLLNANIN